MMTQTLVAKAPQFYHTGNEFVADISDFGLGPGEWPAIVVIEDHDSNTIPLVFKYYSRRMFEGEFVANVYRGMGLGYASWEVHLIND